MSEEDQIAAAIAASLADQNKDNENEKQQQLDKDKVINDLEEKKFDNSDLLDLKVP